MVSPIIEAQELQDVILLFPGECLRILVFLLDVYVCYLCLEKTTSGQFFPKRFLDSLPLHCASFHLFGLSPDFQSISGQAPLFYCMRTAPH